MVSACAVTIADRVSLRVSGAAFEQLRAALVAR
jgi:hypothetical protein